MAVGLVVGELVDHPDAILAVLLRPVAGFAGFARRTQVVDRRGNGPRIRVEGDGDQLAAPESLLFTNQPAPGPMWHLTHSTRECGEF